VIEFATACDAIAALAARSAKTKRLGCYLSSLSGRNLLAAVRFLSGSPLAAHDGRSIAIGGRTLLAAARKLWNPTDEDVSTAYRDTGDLGEALARIVRPTVDLGLFEETLTPASFLDMLEELADARGTSQGKRREGVAVRALRAAQSPREVAYVAKILTGELRIGLREGLVLDAIADAFDAGPAIVRRAAMAAGDIGAVAVAARERTLEAIEIRYGAPIGFMLATPIVFGSSYRELAAGTWLVEDKYDGIRAQAHVRGDEVRLFSRTFSEISRAFPEIVAALRAGASDAIFDGEIVAMRDGAVLPFRYLQPRLQRVDPPAELQAEVPVRFVAFDVLAAGDRFMLDEPLVERRAQIAAHLEPQSAIEIAPWRTLEPGASPETIADLFDAARERGNEGVMLKRTDAPYVPGRRGKWWLKLKRELTTLDVVVVAVEWGHGKRRAMLSDYTFAVRRSATDPELLAIGKAYSGLTDAEITQMTTWFQEHRTGTYGGRAFAVEPSIVIEVAFDIVQQSSLHPSGFSLRFPRIARLRPDKSPSDIDTLEGVQTVYRAMLERERVDR